MKNQVIRKVNVDSGRKSDSSITRLPRCSNRKRKKKNEDEREEGSVGHNWRKTCIPDVFEEDGQERLPYLPKDTNEIA